MKIKDNFILRDLEDQWIVVPIMEAADELNGIISLNETGAFLWKQLQTNCTEENLISSLMNEYNIDEALALKAVQSFIKDLKDANCLE